MKPHGSEPANGFGIRRREWMLPIAPESTSQASVVDSTCEGEEDSEVGAAPSLIESLSGCGSGWA